MSMLTRPAAALVLAALMFGCSDDSDGGGAAAAGTGGATVPEVTFTDDVHPILQMKCGASSACHDGSTAPTLPAHGAADVQEAYDATQAIGQTGEPVYERILARITSDDPMTIMPPTYASPRCEGAIGAPGCITEDELALIRAWIDAGTPL
jgi:hypothetical protein